MEKTGGVLPPSRAAGVRDSAQALRAACRKEPSEGRARENRRTPPESETGPSDGTKRRAMIWISVPGGAIFAAAMVSRSGERRQMRLSLDGFEHQKGRIRIMTKNDPNGTQQPCRCHLAIATVPVQRFEQL